MKFRSLLLGTAAVFAVAGGAKAADLTAAEAIDYVKVCDAYGAGYYYVPGTDTCLRIAGYVQLEAFVYNDATVGNTYNIHSDDPTWPYIDDKAYDSYAAQWEFKTEAGVNFTARTMSDLGPVVTYIAFVSNSNNADVNTQTPGDGKNVRLDNAYGSIGPLLFGWTNSTFDYGGSFTYDKIFREDKKVDQVRWSYMLGTWGLQLGLEDPRDRYDPNSKNATGDFPDIVLALTGSGGGWDWKASAAVTDRTSGTGYGFQFGITGDLGGGFKLRAQGAWSNNAPVLVGGANCIGLCGDDGDWWSAGITGIMALTSNVNAAATFTYMDGDTIGANGAQWYAALGAYWAATSTSEVGIEGFANGSENGDTAYGGRVKFKTYFGG